MIHTTLKFYADSMAQTLLPWSVPATLISFRRCISVRGYNKSVGILSCVSFITQSPIIEQVYLISWSHKVLWNCYFFSKLLFRASTFQGALICQSSFTFSQQLLFQKIVFLRTATFRQLTHFHSYTFYLSCSD